MKNEIVIDGVTYIKKSHEIGDIISFCGMDWYIIDKFNNKLKLMLKDTIRIMTYSDDNSNDYVNSNVKKYLETEFINKLDKSKLIEMKTNYDEDKYVKSKVRIPTLKEIERLPMNIRKSNDRYWAMTSSYGVSGDSVYAYVFAVGSDGYLYYDRVDYTYGVRPVILIEE